MASKILLIDDDEDVREAVGAYLTKSGFNVQAVETAEAALQELRVTTFDLVIIDLSLPGLSGMKACEIIKHTPGTASLPIIMLTANDAERTKVEGLQIGADDYIVKPPSFTELVARVNAILRRIKYAGSPEKILSVGGLKMDVDRHEVTVNGKPIALRPKEFQILTILLEKKGRVVTRASLFDSLWGDDVVTEHTLEVHVNHLRDKLGAMSSCLTTVAGMGYKFQE